VRYKYTLPQFLSREALGKPVNAICISVTVSKQQHLSRVFYVNFVASFWGAEMKRLAACAVAITGLIGTSAFAADMAVKAPPEAPPPPVWTGWYVGVNVGASMGTVKTDFNATSVTVTTTSPSATFNIPGVPGPGTNTESPDGFMGGGQIGYNWQFSPLWVVGVEADFQGSAEKNHNTLTGNFSVGTARLRAGYVWGNGNVFSYVTGGLAYGKVDIEGTNTVSGAVTGTSCMVTCPLAFSTTRAIGHSNVNAGWVLGYGTEGRLAIPGWTWRVESFYMDLGHIHDTDTIICETDGGCPPKPTLISAPTGGQTFTNTHFTDWILRGGLSYQFH
jgi:outer membrane immunogenic protein